MITREKAIEVLTFLESNEILSDELQSCLADIRCCVEAELKGWHFWGADDNEYSELHVARREDLWTDELERKCADIASRHTYTPAPYEANEVGLNAND